MSLRAVLSAEPTLGRSLVDVSPAPLLAPYVSPPLSPEHAEGLDLILEGFLAHHGRPRHLTSLGANDLVLAGDYCYAAGLVRIAAAGDLFVTDALASLVATSAGLAADGRRELLTPLWAATVAAIAAPRTPEVADALRSGDPAALADLAAGLGDLTDLREVLCA